MAGLSTILATVPPYECNEYADGLIFYTYANSTALSTIGVPSAMKVDTGEIFYMITDITSNQGMLLSIISSTAVSGDSSFITAVGTQNTGGYDMATLIISNAGFSIWDAYEISYSPHHIDGLQAVFSP